MDHVLRPPRQKRHVQRVEHQLRGKCRGHRPADDAAAVGIEHHREIQKSCPGRNVSDVGDPQPIRRFCGEVALDQVRRLTAIALHRGGDEPASAHTGKTGLRHQSRDTLAADTSALGRKLGVNARRAVSATRGRVRGTDLRDQCGIRLGPPRRLPLHPCMVAAGGDTQQPAHGGDRIVGLVIAHEPEPFAGIAFVSRANQAAAFERISRSSRSWRFSRRSRWSSSRSARRQAAIAATRIARRLRNPVPDRLRRRFKLARQLLRRAAGAAPVPPSGGGTRVRRLLAS